MTGQSVVAARDLTIGYARRRGEPVRVAGEIDVDLHAGELICLLGPNGSGKSTLIKTLAGMMPRLGGELKLFGKELSRLSPRDVARQLSTVLTDRISIGNLSVYQLVAFGRSPYTGWLGSLAERDEQKVRWAIASTGLRDFASRDIGRLSDGERQKVMIARALAQDTSVILLDEPTAHLDLPNRVEIIRLLRKLAHETGKGILLSTHELDLALKAGDRIWLMNRRENLLSGVPEDLVLNGTFERAFQKDSFDFDRETGSFDIHRSNGKTISLDGDSVPVFWTRRALEREGFKIVDKTAPAGLHVVAMKEEEEQFRWEVDTGRGRKEVCSVEELVSLLRAAVKNSG